MPELFFSEDFKAKMRELVKPLSVKVLREVSSSPEIGIVELRCQLCGFSHTYNPPKSWQATAVHDCEWTHEFSWETGARCGGRIAFVTTPLVLGRT